MPVKPRHQRLLLATYLTFGWIFFIIFQPVFVATTSLVTVVVLGAFGVALALMLVTVVSLAVDRRLPPMRNFPSLHIDESCGIAAVLTGVAVMVVSLILMSLLPRPVPRLASEFLYAVPLWAALMAFLVRAQPQSESTIED